MAETSGDVRKSTTQQLGDNERRTSVKFVKSKTAPERNPDDRISTISKTVDGDRRSSVKSGRSSMKSTDSSMIFKTTPVRWYILTVHALIGIGQCIVYTTWGSIVDSAEKSFGLSQTDFALLPNWFNIMYFFVIGPFMWMIQVIDLRSLEILTAGLTAVGATIRCLNFGHEYDHINRFIIHVGHVINAAGTPIPWMGCPVLSAMWFPPSERALATSLGVSASAVGSALSAFISPMYVHAMAPGKNGEPPTVQELHNAIQSLLYFEAIICQVMLLVTVVYFPARPKYLPSFTAGQERAPFLQGVRQFAKDPQNWIILSVYALASSVFVSWQQIITIFVKPIIDEVEAGWLSFTVQTVGVAGGPIVSATSGLWIDKYPKMVSMVFLAVASAATGLLAFSAFVIKPLFTRWFVWLTMVLAGLCITSCQPVWWEMACDAAYPVAESVISGTFSLSNCAGSFIFFVIFMFPQLGNDWATWALFASEIVCLPLLLIYRPSNKRRLCDMQQQEQPAEEEPPDGEQEIEDVEMNAVSPLPQENETVYSTEL